MVAAPIIIRADEINCLIYSYLQDCGFNHSAFSLRNEGSLQNSQYFQKHIPRGELIELLSKALLYLEVEAHWRDNHLTTNCKSGFSLLEPHICSLEEPAGDGTPDSPDAEMEETGEQEKARGHQQAPQPLAPPSSTAPLPASATSQVRIPLPTRNGSMSHLPKPIETSVSKEDAMMSERSPSLAEAENKRKVSPVQTDAPSDKRARHGSTEMEVDADSQSTDPIQQMVHKLTSLTTQAMRSHSLPASETSRYNSSEAPRPERPQGPGDQITDPRSILMLSGHKTEVFVCAFNPKMHNLLASGSKDGVVNVWDLPSPPPAALASEFAVGPGEPTTLENVSRDTQGDLTSLDWNPDGTLLAIGSYDTILRVCTHQGSIYFSHPQHQGPIFATRFSKNGAWLLTASLDGTTCLWDVKEKRLHKQYRCHQDCCLDVEWLNEDTFASAGADMNIFVMRVDEDSAIKVLNGHKDEINQIRVNPAGTRLASCSDDGTAYIWNIENLGRSTETIPGLSTTEQGVSLKGHNHSVSTVTWCVDHPAGSNELLATSSFDGTARLWDSVTGECLHVFEDHKAPLYSLTFSPNGKYIATGSGDGWLHIYDTRSTQRIWSWFAGVKQPGVFEIDWQEFGDVSRIALALECREVAVVDVNKVEAFRRLQSGAFIPAPPLDSGALWS